MADPEAFKMDQEEVFIPVGWSRVILKGRIVYLTPAPDSVKIYSLADLATYHRKGRFQDVLEDQLVFSRKRKKKEKKYVANKIVSSPAPEEVVEAECSRFSEEVSERFSSESQDMNDFVTLDLPSSCNFPSNPENPVSHILSAKNMKKKVDEKKKLDIEHLKITEAISKLTIDPERKLNHKSVLEDAARRLNEAAVSYL